MSEPVYVDSLDKVGKRSTRTVDPKTRKESLSVIESVARVLTPEGRIGVAVNVTGKRPDGSGEISQVVVRYTEAAPGDVVGLRCIAEGEQRQYHPGDLLVIGVPETESEG